MSDECPGLTEEQIRAVDEATRVLLHILPPEGGVFVLCFQADGQRNGWNFGASNCPVAALIPYLESWIAAKKRRAS